ncbi:MAG: EF-hand domain-containing protein [Methyloligellaceae bacterium]
MSFSRGMIVAGMAMLLLLGGAVSAAEQPAAKGDDWIKLRTSSVVRAGDTVEAARTKLLRLFAKGDIDGGGVSSADHKLLEQLWASGRRAGRMVEWLRWDLDGDATVTRQELNAYYGQKARQPLRSHGVELPPTDEQTKSILKSLVTKALKADANGDGEITFAEALAAAKVELQERRHRRRSEAPPLSLDPNGDGVLTEAEFGAAADRILGRMDADGDGVFSAQEIKAHAKAAFKLRRAEYAARRARREAVKFREKAEGCGLPRAPDGATIVLMGAGKGKALSTVGLGGDDAVVSVADAWIAAGSEPLYVVIAAQQAMVWRFSGAVDRIAALVASSNRADAGDAPRIGVLGVARDRVHIVPRSDCLGTFNKPGSSKAMRLAAALTHFLGRPVDVTVGRYAVSSVSLPNGFFDSQAAYADVVEAPTGGASAPVWQEMKRAYPGGLVRLDAKVVVSRAAAAAYGVLPQQAGIAQLLDEGALAVIGRSRVISLGKTQFVPGGGDQFVVPQGLQPKVWHRPDKFRIKSKIRFPAGLSGAHRVRFVLGRDVPKPDGDPGQSCVIDEATGKPLYATPGC